MKWTAPAQSPGIKGDRRPAQLWAQQDQYTRPHGDSTELQESSKMNRNQGNLRLAMKLHWWNWHWIFEKKKKKNAAMIWGFGCGDMDMEYCITAILKCEILSYYFEFLFPGLCVLHSLSSHHYHFLNFSPHGGKEHVFSHTEAKTKRQTSIIYASFTALHSGV